MARRRSDANVSSGAAERYSLDEHVGHILRRAQQRHTSIFMEEMPGDLTPTQFAALARLEETGSCSQNQLGRLTAIDVATIKGVIDRLGQRNFVATRVDPADRRRSVVELTDEGRAFLEQAFAAAFKITRRTLKPLTRRESEQLLKLLNKISQ